MELEIKRPTQLYVKTLTKDVQKASPRKKHLLKHLLGGNLQN